MRVCETVFDVHTADKVQALLRLAGGGFAPCELGRPCPLLPEPLMLRPRLPGDRFPTKALAPVEQVELDLRSVDAVNTAAIS